MRVSNRYDREKRFSFQVLSIWTKCNKCYGGSNKHQTFTYLKSNITFRILNLILIWTITVQANL
jgi:hypothetical protein